MKVTTGKTNITPAEAGYDESRLTALNNHLAKLIDRNVLQAGAYIMARSGKTFAAGALGPLEFDKADSVLLPETPFRIASITKIVLTVAIMKLVEDGFLRIEDEMRVHLPEFNRKQYEKIKVFHLLTHTSGMMPDWGCFPESEEDNYWVRVDEYINKYDAEKDGEFNWLDAALKLPPFRKIGAEWMYCSFGFAILGELVTRLSGKHVHRYIEDEILKPLGMKDSCFDLTPDLAKRFLIKNSRTREQLLEVINGTNKEEKENLWNRIPSTGGGLHSSLPDLIKFGNMCLNKGTLDGVRIVGRKIFERFTTISIFDTPNYTWGSNSPDRAFGLGFDMKEEDYIYSPNSYFHEGAGACSLIIDPAEEFVLALLIPFGESDAWSAEAVFNTQIVAWSGIK